MIIGDINTIMMMKKSSPLPTGYTLLNYLESDGTQWLNTGLYINGGTPYNLKFRIVTTSDPPTSSNAGVFGARPTNVTGWGLCYFRYSNKNLLCIYSNGTKGLTLPASQTAWHSWDIEVDVRANGEVYINGELTNTVTFNAFTANTYARLFKWNSSSAVTNITWRIYEFETAGCHMYPAMRDADSVVGMYDVEQDVFRTNQGSGTFTYG